MDVNTEMMRQYAEFLEQWSNSIIILCNNMESLMPVAVQCMDQQSGREAAVRMYQNMEDVKANVPISDDAVQRLIKTLKIINDAGNVFGGRSR